MVKKKTILRFQEWSADPLNLEDLLNRVANGGKLEKVCNELKQPYTLVFSLLQSRLDLRKRYEDAKKMFAHKIREKKLEIAEEARKATEPVQVMGAKLASEIYESEAKAWDRERFGETVAPQTVVNLNLGDVAREIRELEARLGLSAPNVVEALPAPVEAVLVEDEPI